MGQPTSECQEQIFCADKTHEFLELLTNSKDEIITVKVPQLNGSASKVNYFVKKKHF